MLGFKNKKRIVEANNVLKNVILEQIATEEDGNICVNLQHYKNSSYVEFDKNGDFKSVVYDPKRYQRESKKVQRIQRREEIRNERMRQEPECETYPDLYLKHLAGDITSSNLIGLDPDDK